MFGSATYLIWLLVFIGLPLLGGALAGAEYVATARAQPGTSGGPPQSIIGSRRATRSSPERRQQASTSR